MKKIFIAIALIFLLVFSIFVVVHLVDNNVATNNTNEYDTEIYVDGWLKITKICEYDGRLALVAENVSDVDVEYALLTAKNKNDSFTFNISVLLRGTKVMLICNEPVEFVSDEIYTGWKIENIVNFENVPTISDGKYEVSVLDGSISVRNVSREDITSEILIYYKEKYGDILNGSVTHRVRISELKADSQTYINVSGLNENNCQILFTEYSDKKS